jgi:hypothetical protein
MSQPTRPPNRTDVGPDVYLPASLLPSALDRIEGVARRVFGRHGVVPIPRTYNR